MISQLSTVNLKMSSYTILSIIAKMLVANNSVYELKLKNKDILGVGYILNQADVSAFSRKTPIPLPKHLIMFFITSSTYSNFLFSHMGFSFIPA